MIRPGSLILAIGYVVGLAVIAQQLLPPSTQDPGTAEPVLINLAEAVAPPAVNLSLDVFDAIIERPLFRADRIPAPETAADPVPIQPLAEAERSADLTGLRLSAVIRGPDLMTALLELPDGESRAVAKGDRVENWTVVEILDDRLVLNHRDKRVTLNLHDLSYLKNRPPPRARAVAERRRPSSRQLPRTRRRLPEASRPPRERRNEAPEEID